MQRQERPRSPVAMLLGPLVVVVVVASVIGTLAATGRFSAGNGGAAGAGVLGAPITLSTLSTAQLLCPSSAGFSPDGSELAIIGSTNSCHTVPYGLQSFNAHVLALYDAHLGTLQRTVPLDALLGYDPYAPRAEQRIQAVRYIGLGWSPAGKDVAVVYATFDSASDITFEHIVDSGLLLIDTTTGRPAAVKGDAGFFSPTGVYSGYPVWNLGQRVVSPPASPVSGLTYTWTAGGALRPMIPLDGRRLSVLPVSAGAKYPVGDPDGDSTFTVWQPGVLLGSGIVTVGHGRDAFVTAFPSWSVNGTFTTMMLAGAAVPGAGPGQSSATAPNNAALPTVPLPAILPSVPARDAALTSVAAEIGAADWALVAWNPAGSVLASIDCGATGSPTVEVRDTGTGNVLGTAHVPLPAGDAGCREYNAPESLGDYPNPDMTLSWSPDGHTLLVSDERASTLALWQVNMVGASS